MVKLQEGNVRIVSNNSSQKRNEYVGYPAAQCGGIVLKTLAAMLSLVGWCHWCTQFNELSSFLFLNFQNHRQAASSTAPKTDIERQPAAAVRLAFSVNGRTKSCWYFSQVRSLSCSGPCSWSFAYVALYAPFDAERTSCVPPFCHTTFPIARMDNDGAME